jgi:acyl carrier protein
MISDEKIQQLIYEVVDEINAKLPEDEQLTKEPETLLYGEEGNLDSLGLVIFVAAIEKKLEDELGAVITIVNEKILSAENSPLKSISSLVNYIATLV